MQLHNIKQIKEYLLNKTFNCLEWQEETPLGWKRTRVSRKYEENKPYFLSLSYGQNWRDQKSTFHTLAEVAKLIFKNRKYVNKKLKDPIGLF